MRKIVIDMQNYLFADAVATAFKSSDYDIEVIRAESPRDTVELCQIYEPFVLVMEVTGYAPWKLGERLRLRDEVKALCPSMPLFGISRRSGWWATAEACSAWCPVTPTPPWR